MRATTKSNTCVVVTSHTPPTYDPIVFVNGARVVIEKRDTEWPEFLWCISGKGEGAWVPESYLNRDDDIGVLNVAYSSAELKADKGEQLTIVKSIGGWHWCRNSEGKLGWIPERNVEREEKRM
jgi:hypothetical protein